MSQLPPAVKALTGVDLSGVLGQIPGAKTQIPASSVQWPQILYYAGYNQRGIQEKISRHSENSPLKGLSVLKARLDYS